jgi:hypothetical protein
MFLATAERVALAGIVTDEPDDFINASVICLMLRMFVFSIIGA